MSKVRAPQYDKLAETTTKAQRRRYAVSHRAGSLPAKEPANPYMAELASGAFAPSTTYVYTANDFPIAHRFSPLIIKLLGKPRGVSRNRLILPVALLNWAEFETAAPIHSGKNAESNLLDQGSNDAATD
jgi:hypothetical protein